MRLSSHCLPAGIYSWRWLTDRPAKPQKAGTGRTFIRIIPLFHARPAYAGPILAGGGEELARVHPWLYGHMGEVHPRGGLPWILFLYVFFLLRL